MKFNRFLLLTALNIGLNSVYSQNSVSLKINRNVPLNSYKNGGFINFGLGFSYIRKDLKERFINYELSAGLDLDNLTVKDQYYDFPFIDYNKVYKHKINSLNLNLSVSAKKRFRIKGDFTPYIGIGLMPSCFLLSKAKVYYNNSLIKRDNGLRLARLDERLKIYDLFYICLEYRKRIDFRLNMQGAIMKKLGMNNFYYYNAENNISYSQYSLQVIINLYK